MKYVDEYRERTLAQSLSQQIAATARQSWRIMEVCGGQTHTILQYGLEDLLPPQIELLHGPGCPVCVTPVALIDQAVAIAMSPQAILCSFGDMLRVPGSSTDLLQCRALGADVRIVYSPLEAVALAQRHQDKKVVFFAVGFETTAPANAMAAYQARQLGLRNFFLLCSHVTVPPVMSAILSAEDNGVQAFLGPGHVCSVMGTAQYEALVQEFKTPIVICGFEPTDLLEGILRCVTQLENGGACLENQYARAVSRSGNGAAQEIVGQVFTVSDREWRGLGTIALSGLELSADYAEFDAAREFLSLKPGYAIKENELCISGEVLRGLKKPWQCPAFGRQCTPETPLGATMVSAEGTCANYFKFAKGQKDEVRSRNYD